MSLTRKKFISHATCHNSLGLQEQETYLIMGHALDLWKVKSACVGAPAVPGLRRGAPLPYPSPVPSVNNSYQHLSPISRSLRFQGCPEGRCRLRTAQLQLGGGG